MSNLENDLKVTLVLDSPERTLNLECSQLSETHLQAFTSLGLFDESP